MKKSRQYVPGSELRKQRVQLRKGKAGICRAEFHLWRKLYEEELKKEAAEHYMVYTEGKTLTG